MTLLLFGAVLFGGNTRVLGQQTTDMALQFLAWRDFGFRELRAGNLALWNPHIYAGAPYFGGFQGALLYPLNVLFLVMPVAWAVNWTLAMHVWLLGALTYGWVGVSLVDWQALMQRMLATGEAYLPPATYAQPAFVAQAQHDAAYALFVAAGMSLVLGLLLLGMRYTPRLVVGVLALTVVELGVFAARTQATFDSTTVVPTALRTFLARHPGAYRMLNPRNANSAMLVGTADVWGSDPGVVRRYAEFMTWSQGGTPDQATQYVQFTRLDPLYAMLRLRYALMPDEHRIRVLEAPQAPMDRVHVVTRYRVVADRDAIFSVLRSGASIRAARSSWNANRCHGQLHRSTLARRRSWRLQRTGSRSPPRWHHHPCW